MTKLQCHRDRWKCVWSSTPNPNQSLPHISVLKESIIRTNTSSSPASSSAYRFPLDPRKFTTGLDGKIGKTDSYNIPINVNTLFNSFQMKQRRDMRQYNGDSIDWWIMGQQRTTRVETKIQMHERSRLDPSIAHDLAFLWSFTESSHSFNFLSEQFHTR